MHGDLPLDDHAVETLLRGQTTPGAPPELVGLVSALRTSAASTPAPEDTIDLALVLVTGREPTPAPARSTRPRHAVAAGVVAATLAIASPLAALPGATSAIGRSLGLLPPRIVEPAAPGPRVAPLSKARAASNPAAELRPVETGDSRGPRTVSDMFTFAVPTTVPPFVGVPERAAAGTASNPTHGTPGRAATATGEDNLPGQDEEPANQATTPPTDAGTTPETGAEPPPEPAPDDTSPDDGTAPGHDGTPPGQDGAPGSSADAPGHTETPPGHGGTPPGHGGTPPGHGGTPPGPAQPSPSSTEPENDNRWSEQ